MMVVLALTAMNLHLMAYADTEDQDPIANDAQCDRESTLSASVRYSENNSHEIAISSYLVRLRMSNLFTNIKDTRPFSRRLS